MTEESVSYGKEPNFDEFHIGDLIWVEDHGSKLYRQGKITKIDGDYLHFETHTGDEYFTQKKYAKVIGTNFEAPYGVSYVADKPMETPEHYKMTIEPLEFALKNGLGVCEFNILKYICRHKRKNGKEDLLKAKVYLERLIQFEYPDLEVHD